MNGCGCSESGKYLTSVVIPAVEDSVLTSLNSLLNQTRLPDEVIVVDQGLSREGREEVEKFNCVVLDEAKDELNARCKGFKEASGDIVFSCEAGKIYSPTFLEGMTYPIEQGRVVATVTSSDSVRNIAVLKDAYLGAGGFDCRFSSGSVDGEELILTNEGFIERLADTGRIEIMKPGEEGFRAGPSDSVPITVPLALLGSGIAAVASEGFESEFGVGTGAGFAAGEMVSNLEGLPLGRGSIRAEELGLSNDRGENNWLGIAMVGAGSFLGSPGLAGAGVGFLGQYLAERAMEFLPEERFERGGVRKTSFEVQNITT